MYPVYGNHLIEYHIPGASITPDGITKGASPNYQPKFLLLTFSLDYKCGSGVKGPYFIFLTYYML